MKTSLMIWKTFAFCTAGKGPGGGVGGSHLRGGGGGFGGSRYAREKKILPLVIVDIGIELVTITLRYFIFRSSGARNDKC